MAHSPFQSADLDAAAMVAVDQAARRHQAQAVRRLFWDIVDRLLKRPTVVANENAAGEDLAGSGRVAVRYDAIESLLALNDNDLARLGLDRRSLELYRDGAIKHLMIVA